MSRHASRPCRDAVIWHDVECGSYEADLAALGAPRRRRRRARARPRLRQRAGRPPPRPPRTSGHRCRSQPRAGRRARTARAGAEELPAQAVIGDVRALDLGRRFDLVIAPMQLVQVLDGEPRAARACCGRSPATSPRAAAPPLRSLPASSPPRASITSRCPTCARATAGSAPACRSQCASPTTACRRHRLRQTCLAGGRDERGAQRRSTCAASRSSGSAAEAASGRARRSRRRSRCRRPRTTSARSSRSWRRR